MAVQNINKHPEVVQNVCEQRSLVSGSVCHEGLESVCIKSLRIIKKAITGLSHLLAAPGQFNPVQQSQCWEFSCGFEVLLVADAMSEDPSQFAAGRFWGRSGASWGWLILQVLNFERCCADQQELGEFRRDHGFPKSHNFPYDVKLMKINSSIWERHPKRPWAEFVSSYGASFVWLKTSNETRILTLYPLLEATRSRKASWLEITGPKWRNKFT